MRTGGPLVEMHNFYPTAHFIASSGANIISPQLKLFFKKIKEWTFQLITTQIIARYKPINFELPPNRLGHYIMFTTTDRWGTDTSFKGILPIPVRKDFSGLKGN